MSTPVLHRRSQCTMTTMTLPDTAAAQRALAAATEELIRARAHQVHLDQQWRTAVLIALGAGTGPRALAPLAGVSHGRISQLRTESRAPSVGSADIAGKTSASSAVSDGESASPAGAGTAGGQTAEGRADTARTTSVEQALAEVRRATAARHLAVEQVAAAEAHRNQMIRAASRALVPQSDLMGETDLSRDRILRILRAAPATPTR